MAQFYFVFVSLLIFSLNGKSDCGDEKGIEGAIQKMENNRDDRIQELADQINKNPTFKQKAKQAQSSKIEETVRERQQISQKGIVNENELVSQIAEKADKMQNAPDPLKAKSTKSEVNSTKLAEDLRMRQKEIEGKEVSNLVDGEYKRKVEMKGEVNKTEHAKQLSERMAEIEAKEVSKNVDEKKKAKLEEGGKVNNDEFTKKLAMKAERDRMERIREAGEKRRQKQIEEEKEREQAKQGPWGGRKVFVQRKTANVEGKKNGVEPSEGQKKMLGL